VVNWLREHLPGAGYGLSALEQETTAGGTLIAGGLAYRLFLWLLPFSLVIATGASFWEREDDQGLETAAEEFGMSASAATSMTEAVEGGAHGRWYSLIFGLVFLMWFAIGAVRALRLAHAVAWRTPRERFRRPIPAGLVFTLFATALIVVTGAAQWLREQAGVGGLVVTLMVVLVYAAGALWAMRLLPHGDAPWTALIPGAVLVAVGFQALHLFAVLYLVPRLGRSSELYGSLGAATVILLWLYIVARLITLSAFLNATLWERRTP
jgi:membrane protein